jgi:hypothetical protein
VSRKGESPWTEERIELLKAWWAEGKSAGEIAYLMPGGFSRCAIIGKAHRLGLKGRAAAAKAAAGVLNTRHSRESRKRNTDAPKSKAAGHPWFTGTGSKPPQPQPPERAKSAAEIARAPRPWETRAFGECAFPLEQPDGAVFSCCNPVDPPRVDWCYCAGHYARLTTKPSNAHWSEAQRAAARLRTLKMNAARRAAA